MKAAESTFLDGGATVPFIARYRKEAQAPSTTRRLRTLEERLGYLRDLEARRAAVLEGIEAQGKLDAALKACILAAETKARLEDLYLPFKIKRRTKRRPPARPVSRRWPRILLARPDQRPETAGAAYVDAGKGVADAEAALEGARAILIERFSEDPELVGSLRETGWQRGRLVATVKAGQARRREVLGLLRFLRTADEAALASHPGPVPGREGGGARSRHRGRGGRRAGQGPALVPGTAHRENLRHPRPGPTGRRLPDGDGAPPRLRIPSSPPPTRISAARLWTGAEAGR